SPFGQLANEMKLRTSAAEWPQGTPSVELIETGGKPFGKETVRLVRQCMAALKIIEKKLASRESKIELDVARDQICVLIRKALAVNDFLLTPLVDQCGGDQVRSTVKNRLKLLKKAKHVKQTGTRGPYTLLDAGKEQQRRD